VATLSYTTSGDMIRPKAALETERRSNRSPKLLVVSSGHWCSTLTVPGPARTARGRQRRHAGRRHLATAELHRMVHVLADGPGITAITSVFGRAPAATGPGREVTGDGDRPVDQRTPTNAMGCAAAAGRCRHFLGSRAVRSAGGRPPEQNAGRLRREAARGDLRLPSDRALESLRYYGPRRSAPVDRPRVESFDRCRDPFPVKS
jgi:hypothetical protein